MKIKLLLGILFLVVIKAANSQTYSLKGLELYNNYYVNPANIIAESRIQFDIIPYNLIFYKGINSNLLLSAPEINSGIGVGVQRGNTDPMFYSSVNLDYAYKHSFSESTSITGGVRLVYSKSSFDNTHFPDFPTISKTAIGTNAGILFKYKKFHSGASIGIPVITKREYYISELETETVKEENPNNTYQFLCGYRFGKKHLILFDPLLSIRHSQYSTTWYLGANTLIKNTVGFGFTAGDITSLSTSLSIKNKVTMILGVFSKENGFSSQSYWLDISDKEFIVQIRINL